MATELAIPPAITPRRTWPSGFAPLDRALPGSGLPADGVTEVMHPGRSPGAGCLSLFIPLMRRLTRGPQNDDEDAPQSDWNALNKEATDEQPHPDTPRAPAWIALVEPGLDLYPPALAAAGVDLSRVLILRPNKRADQLWAIEQCMKHPSIAFTLSAVRGLQEREARRLQLACQSGPGVLLRPESESGRASSLRLGLRAESTGDVRSDGIFSQRFEIEVLRCRGLMPGAPIQVEVKDDGSPMVLSALSRVSMPARGQKPTRAEAQSLGVG